MPMISRLAVSAVLLVTSSVSSFTPLSIHQRQYTLNKFKIMTSSPVASIVSYMADETDAMDIGPVSQQEEDETVVRVEPGTHEELMYALGVNLARQLGDIRPLVENGDELAQVAKGLLDTVVGRLNDDGQRLLLAKRGKELDELIVTRA